MPSPLSVEQVVEMEPQEEAELAHHEEEASVPETVNKTSTTPREEEEDNRLQEPESPGLPEAHQEVPLQVGNNRVLEAVHKLQAELQALITTANHQQLTLEEAQVKLQR